MEKPTLVVIGEGLAAGMGDFSLHAGSQQHSFPGQVAAALQLPFAVSLIEPPGIHVPAGFEAPPMALPLRTQSGVLERIPPTPPTNLAVPGYRLNDALHRRPRQPVIDRNDPTQTACNLILGMLDLAAGSAQASTQLEYAVRSLPALVFVCLGYQEALDAIVGRTRDERPDATRVPSAQAFHQAYVRILDTLGDDARVVVFTVPNPADTAYCCSVDEAASVCCVEPTVLCDLYGFTDDRLLTVSGLHEIGYQLFAGERADLPPSVWVPVDTVLDVERRLGDINDALQTLATARGAAVCDLHALFRWIAECGVRIGDRSLSARYLGGFYRLNGIYPGSAGHAVIANAAIEVIAASFGWHPALIDVTDVAARDPVAQHQLAVGRRWDLQNLPRRLSSAVAPAREISVEPCQGQCRGGELAEKGAPGRLRLPDGLEQILPINKASSYFGDGISPVNCSEPRDVRWGSSGEYLFGGLAMVDSHLEGNLRVRFSPISSSLARFELFYDDGFVGDDSIPAPHLFGMPFQKTGVSEIPGLVSQGTLNLDTGEATDLEVYALFHSTALQVLVEMNPTFPKQPLTFPGPYGSAWARFEQRDDGLLDFTFYGSTFVPLGDGIRWPLNFHSRDGHFASVPANGTSMHPHLHLSTKAQDREGVATGAPAIPFNTIRELTLYSHNSSFGDQFTLEVPQLGGYAKGRSHVLGRVHIQFGPRCGTSVPIAVACLGPGGVLAEMDPSPISQVFPGRLYPGPQGFYEYLRFPTRTYALDDLSILDAPFDIAMAAIDLETGHSLNEMLHRGFIHQDLILALLRVEPRTPKTSFLFRGPCQLENGPKGELAYRYKGLVRVPYPPGFLFPQPDLTSAFVVGENSVLDPFLWLQAMEAPGDHRSPACGQLANVTSSQGETFSCRYHISGRTGEPAVFEYENHSQCGRFRLLTLSAAAFTYSRSARAGGYDTVTFSGFGVWSKDGHESLQQVAAQISWSAATPYVGIQIDRGSVSNVNTKPEIERLALP